MGSREDTKPVLFATSGWSQLDPLPVAAVPLAAKPRPGHEESDLEPKDHQDRERCSLHRCDRRFFGKKAEEPKEQARGKGRPCCSAQDAGGGRVCGHHVPATKLTHTLEHVAQRGTSTMSKTPPVVLDAHQR